ncbi:MAG: hypothetical protein R6U65_11495, partial [Perlabentimonas sp.]
LSASWTYARKGKYYQYIRGMQDPRVDELDVLEEITWDSRRVEFMVQYSPFPNTRFFGKFLANNTQGYDVDGRFSQDYLDLFSPSNLHGETYTFEFGFGIGF